MLFSDLTLQILRFKELYLEIKIEKLKNVFGINCQNFEKNFRSFKLFKEKRNMS
jgi:hypothetical protein